MSAMSEMSAIRGDRSQLGDGFVGGARRAGSEPRKLSGR